MLILEGDFADKLKSVLADPDAMSKITAIASGLGLGSDNANRPAPTNEPSAAAAEDAPQTASQSLAAFSGSTFSEPDPRLALLNSLKPLIREDRRDRLDALTKALTLASVMKNLKK